MSAELLLNFRCHRNLFMKQKILHEDETKANFIENKN